MVVLEGVRWAVLEAGEVVVVRIVRDWQVGGVVIMQSNVGLRLICQNNFGNNREFFHMNNAGIIGDKTSLRITTIY